MHRLLSLLLVLVTATHAVAVAAADTAAVDALDLPATRSALAPRSLLNGLARAGDRVVAVGQRGHVLYSDDAGVNWQQAEVPVSSDLVAVSFPSASSGWAVGHDGVIIHTSDAGATWSRQLDGRSAGALMLETYPEDASGKDAKNASALHEQAQRFAAQGAENPFLDVWFADERNGFVVGAFGLILQPPMPARPGSHGCTRSTTRVDCICTRFATRVRTSISSASRGWRCGSTARPPGSSDWNCLTRERCSA